MSLSVDTRGMTRTVLLTRRWAVKVPGIWLSPHRRGHRWKHFLVGLVANMQEVELSRTAWEPPEDLPGRLLCPVVWSLWGGWLLVMVRARMVTDEEWSEILLDGRLEPVLREFRRRAAVELKREHFGYLDGQLVCVDYGALG